MLSVRSIVWALVGLLASSRSTGFHQQRQTDTPKIIETLTEDNEAAGDGSRMVAFLTALRGASETRELHWIAAAPLTGTLNQTMALFEYSDLASVKRANDVRQLVWKNLPAASRPRLHSRIWQLSPDQSFGDGLVPWSAAAALTLLVVNTSVGGFDEYAEQQQLAAQLLAKAHVTNEEWLGYSLRFGPDHPAFMFITPFRSVAAIDSAVFHGEVLPPPVDRARSAVLRESVTGSAWTLMAIRPELGSVNH
jgi:hypothetical protein